VEFELPFPPSLNHLWRRVGHRTLLSRGGRAFRRAVRVALAARGVRPLDGPLAVTIDVHPPDRRRRDLDNLQKALLDALAHGGAYHDDAQIDDLHIRRCGCVPGGKVFVRVTPHGQTGAAAAEDAPGPRDDAPGEPPPGPPDDTPVAARQRTCLKCDRAFHSSGPGNRICPPCQRDNGRLRLSERELRSQGGVRRRNGELVTPSGLDGGSA